MEGGVRPGEVSRPAEVLFRVPICDFFTGELKALHLFIGVVYRLRTKACLVSGTTMKG
jgi:hypothetical protein